jgi:hypothetical protein
MSRNGWWSSVAPGLKFFERHADIQVVKVRHGVEIESLIGPPNKGA